MRTRQNFLCFSIVLLIFFAGNSTESYAQAGYKIQGRVIDFDTQQPLKGISVIVRENKQGTLTNDSGYFSLVSPVQNITLSFSSIGYVNSRQHLDL
jgi:hypothetical protein